MFKKNKRKDERQQHKLIKMWEGSGFHLYAVTFPALSIKFFFLSVATDGAHCSEKTDIFFFKTNTDLVVVTPCSKLHFSLNL